MKGSYILVIRIQRSLRLKPGSLPSVKLQRGYYLYVGSAKGPGGFEKRVFRHLKKFKKARWHIDYLTRLKDVKIEGLFYISPEYDESMLTRLLLSLGFKGAVRGFGSTDSPKDFSHLLMSEKDLGETVNTIKSAMRRKRLFFKFFNEESLRRFKKTRMV